MTELVLKSDLEELRRAHIKPKEEVVKVNPNYADLGALRNTEFNDWVFLTPLVMDYYTDFQKNTWNDTEMMARAFKLLQGFIERKLIKRPTMAQELIDLLLLLYKDVQEGEANLEERQIEGERLNIIDTTKYE